MMGCRVDGSRFRGAALLEMVLALSLFVAAATVITGVLHSSVRAVRDFGDEANAARVASSVLGEIRAAVRPMQRLRPTRLDPPLQRWVLSVEIQSPDGRLADLGLRRVTVSVEDPERGTRSTVGQLMRDPVLAAMLETAVAEAVFVGDGGAVAGERADDGTDDEADSAGGADAEGEADAAGEAGAGEVEP